MRLKFITPDQVLVQALEFGRASNFARRKKLLRHLIFLATDKVYNSTWKESDTTRKAVVEVLLRRCFFQVKNPYEEELIINGIKKIVWFKQTLLALNGEASPVVQTAIIRGLDFLLHADRKLDQEIKKMTTSTYFAKVRLAELGKSLLNMGSLKNPYLIPPPPVSKQEYKSIPLSRSTKKVFQQILTHYAQSRIPEAKHLAREVILKYEH